MNRNYKRMCIRSKISLCTEHDFHTVTADLFVDRHTATDIDDIILYLCTN